MKYRRFMAAVAAMTVMASMVSCGKDKQKSSSSTASSKAVSDTETVSSDTESADDEETTDPDGKKTTTTAKDKDGKSDKSGTTTTKAGEKKSEGTTTTAKGGSSGSSSGGNNSSSGGSNSSGSSNTSGGNSSSGGSSSGSSSGNSSGGSSSGGSSTGATGEVKEYTAEIVLGNAPKVTGSNVTVNGSTVIITAEGDYIFSGSVSEGQIVVKTGVAKTEDKVTLVLNGVDISNSSQPAIFIDECKRCTIKPKEGSVNYVSSGVEKKSAHETGAIFSNDTIKLKGNGELNITATASHGINSDDDVVIESGTYNIESRKSGIIANTDVTINDGNIRVKSGTNGIKSEGTLNINGGYTVISGGTKEEKSAVYAYSTFSYKNGYLYAAGNKVSTPTYSDHPYIVADLGEVIGGGSTVEMVLDGTQVVSMEPHNEFRCLMMLSPDVHEGSNFYTVINGNSSEEFNVSVGQNLFSLK